MLLRVLADRPSGETSDRLQAFCSPKELWRDKAAPATIFDQNLRAARNMGLIVEIDDKLCLAAGIVSGKGREDADLRRFLAKTLLNPMIAEDDPQIDFARALSWFLMQAPQRPLAFSTGYGNSIKNQLGAQVGEFDLTSKDRWNAFFYWCRYLGYGEALTDRALAADPTQALNRLLPTIFAHDRDLTIAAFLQALAQLTPVFETGRVRAELERQASADFARESHRLSKSTSLALKRLEQQGRIDLDPSADAATMILDLGADAPERLSRIRWKGGQ
jgi:hypothetical protein